MSTAYELPSNRKILYRYKFLEEHDTKKLSVVFCNYLVLHQLELARATLRHLHSLAPKTAIALVHNVLSNQVSFEGLIRTPHLVWFCFKEYVRLISKEEKESKRELSKSFIQHIEFDLLLERAQEDFWKSHYSVSSHVVKEINDTFIRSMDQRTQHYFSMSQDAQQFFSNLFLISPHVCDAIYTRLEQGIEFQTKENIQSSLVDVIQSKFRQYESLQDSNRDPYLQESLYLLQCIRIESRMTSAKHKLDSLLSDIIKHTDGDHVTSIRDEPVAEDHTLHEHDRDNNNHDDGTDSYQFDPISTSRHVPVVSLIDVYQAFLGNNDDTGIQSLHRLQHIEDQDINNRSIISLIQDFSSHSQENDTVRDHAPNDSHNVSHYSSADKTDRFWRWFSSIVRRRPSRSSHILGDIIDAVLPCVLDQDNLQDARLLLSASALHNPLRPLAVVLLWDMLPRSFVQKKNLIDVLWTSFDADNQHDDGTGNALLSQRMRKCCDELEYACQLSLWMKNNIIEIDSRHPDRSAAAAAAADDDGNVASTPPPIPADSTDPIPACYEKMPMLYECLRHYRTEPSETNEDAIATTLLTGIMEHKISPALVLLPWMTEMDDAGVVTMMERWPHLSRENQEDHHVQVTVFITFFMIHRMILLASSPSSVNGKEDRHHAVSQFLAYGNRMLQRVPCSLHKVAVLEDIYTTLFARNSSFAERSVHGSRNRDPTDNLPSEDGFLCDQIMFESVLDMLQTQLNQLHRDSDQEPDPRLKIRIEQFQIFLTETKWRTDFANWVLNEAPPSRKDDTRRQRDFISMVLAPKETMVAVSLRGNNMNKTREIVRFFSQTSSLQMELENREQIERIEENINDNNQIIQIAKTFNHSKSIVDLSLLLGYASNDKILSLLHEAKDGTHPGSEPGSAFVRRILSLLEAAGSTPLNTALSRLIRYPVHPSDLHACLDRPSRETVALRHLCRLANHAPSSSRPGTGSVADAAPVFSAGDDNDNNASQRTSYLGQFLNVVLASWRMLSTKSSSSPSSPVLSDNVFSVISESPLFHMSQCIFHDNDFETAEKLAQIYNLDIVDCILYLCRSSSSSSSVSRQHHPSHPLPFITMSPQLGAYISRQSPFRGAAACLLLHRNDRCPSSEIDTALSMTRDHPVLRRWILHRAQVFSDFVDIAWRMHGNNRSRHKNTVSSSSSSSSSTLRNDLKPEFGLDVDIAFPKKDHRPLHQRGIQPHGSQDSPSDEARSSALEEEEASILQPSASFSSFLAMSQVNFRSPDEGSNPPREEHHDGPGHRHLQSITQRPLPVDGDDLQRALLPTIDSKTETGHEPFFQAVVQRFLLDGDAAAALTYGDRGLPGGAPDYVLKAVLSKPGNVYRLPQLLRRVYDRRYAASIIFQNLRHWPVHVSLDLLYMITCMPDEDVGGHYVKEKALQLRKRFSLYRRILSIEDQSPLIKSLNGSWTRLDHLVATDTPGLVRELIGLHQFDMGRDLIDSFGFGLHDDDESEDNGEDKKYQEEAGAVSEKRKESEHEARPQDNDSEDEANDEEDSQHWERENGDKREWMEQKRKELRIILESESILYTLQKQGLLGGEHQTRTNPDRQDADNDNDKDKHNINEHEHGHGGGEKKKKNDDEQDEQQNWIKMITDMRQLGQLAVPVCENVLEHTSSLPSRLFITEYMLTHLEGYLDEETVDELRQIRQGLKILLNVEELDQARFSHLVKKPILIIESLLMMNKMQQISNILKNNPTLNFDELLIRYARKALDLVFGNESSTFETNFFSTSHHPQSPSSSLSSPAVESNHQHNSTPSSHTGDTSPNHSPPSKSTSPSTLALTTYTLTGNDVQDDQIRRSHNYHQAPSIFLCKAILDLCRRPLHAGRSCFDLCDRLSRKTKDLDREQRRQVLHLMEQLAVYAKLLFMRDHEGHRHLSVCDSFISHVYLFHRIILADCGMDSVSLAQLRDQNYARNLRDRLIDKDQMELALNVATKLKLESRPVWEAWGMSLLRLGRYATARRKFQYCHGMSPGQKSMLLKRILRVLETPNIADILSVGSPSSTVPSSPHRSTSISSSPSSSSSSSLPPNASSPRSQNNRRQSRSTLSHLFGRSPFSSPSKPDANHPSSNAVRGEDGDHSPRQTANEQPGTLSKRKFTEMLYYVDLFGTENQEISLYLRHDMMAAAYRQIQIKDLSPAFFVHTVGEYALHRGQIDVLKQILRKEDPSLKESHRYLASFCKYLMEHRKYRLLYDLQVFMNDNVRAALTCTRMFQADVSSPVPTLLDHLERAKQHLVSGMLENQGQDGAAPQRSGGATVKDSKEIQKLLRVVKLQIEVTKAGGFGVQRHNLFDSIKHKCEIAEKLCTIDFDLSFRIINEFQLPAARIYTQAAIGLARHNQVQSINDLLRNVKGMLSSAREWDVLVLSIVKSLAFEAGNRKSAESFIPQIVDVSSKIDACIACRTFKNAYMLAAQNGDTDSVRKIAQEAERSGGRAARTVADMCNKYLKKHEL